MGNSHLYTMSASNLRNLCKDLFIFCYTLDILSLGMFLYLFYTLDIFCLGPFVSWTFGPLSILTLDVFDALGVLFLGHLNNGRFDFLELWTFWDF